MYVGKDFDPLDPGEQRIFSLDFTKDLAPGETITGAVGGNWVMTPIIGTDVTGAGPSGALGINGAIVSQMAGNATPGVKYRLGVTVTTSKGQTLPLYSHVACKALA